MKTFQASRALCWLSVALHGGLVLADDAAPCTLSLTAKTGDSCLSLAVANGLSVAQFVQMNPTITSCTLTAGSVYCVSTVPGARAPTSVAITTTSVSSPAAASPTSSLIPSPDGSDGICGNGYTCLGSVYGDCCSLNGYCGNSTDYCGEGCNPIFGRCGGGEVAPSDGTHTVTVTVTVTSAQTQTVLVTVTPSATAVAAPTPLLTGTTKSCKKYYQIKRTDSCLRLARTYGITTDSIYTWNPNFDCDDVMTYAGYYICVGV